VMEYVGGATLGAHRGEGAHSETEVVRLGLQLAEGLAAAHAEGIVHRDLKPANVRLTSDGRLKILDFGLAHLARPAGDGAGSAAPTQSASMTEAGALVGTLGYMAPEQVRGERADARADLWAAGLVLYELATGRAGYAHAETAPLLHAILNESVVLPRKVNHHLSAALEAIILKCVEKEPAKRYATARELAADLQRLQQGASVAAERSRTHARRLRTLAVAGPVAVVVVLVTLTALNVGGLRTRLFAPAPIRSIAVLPLANLSGDPEQEYFADGMTEQLINDLGQVSALRVISRTSAMQYKGTKKGLKEIARELGVDGIVEGSVVRSGERVKITAQLIRAAQDRQMWAQTYESDLKDVLVTQGEIAGTIAGAVRVRLTAGEQTRLAKSRPVNPAAYELYLKGRYHLEQYGSPAELERALALLAEAVRHDSTSALLAAELARAYSLVVIMGLRPANEEWPRIRKIASRAVALDGDLALGHAVLGQAMITFAWDWRGAERELRRAISLDPSSAETRSAYALYFVTVGRWDEAVEEGERALSLDPVSVSRNQGTAWLLYYARRFDQSIAQARRTLELEPGFPYAPLFMAYSLSMKGMHDQACREARTALAAVPQDQVVLAGSGGVFARAGRRGEALAVLERLRALARTTYVEPYNFAWLWDGLGDNDSTVAWLDHSYRERSASMYLVRSETWTDRLRADPRFQDLVRRMNYPPEPKH
jgi:TolB-like protein/Tfp pilus assembly protein PilF